MYSHTLLFLIDEAEKRSAEEAQMASSEQPPSPIPKKRRTSSRLATRDHKRVVGEVISLLDYIV